MHLLDVNVLLALAYEGHVHHQRARIWIRGLNWEPEQAPAFGTCSIVELGFIRIASGPSGLAENLNVARANLCRLKTQLGLILLADDLDGNRLPAWVSRSGQTTDGHLVELASVHSVRLVTLDGGIPGAVLIPDNPTAASMVKDAPRYGAAA